MAQSRRGPAEDLRAELDRIRLRGFASDGEWQEGIIHSVAVPVRNYTGAAIGSLAVDGPVERWTEQRALSFAPDVIERGRAISRALGYAGQAGGRDVGTARQA